MSDFDERLRAADPAAGMSYQHPNVDAMISRIEARAPLARRHVLRSFQLKMASAVTMAAVLTVGGIAVLDGAGPALQVLALGAAKTSPHAPSAFGAQAVPKSGLMRLYEEFDFSAGSGLSSSAASAPSYQLSLPASAQSEASRLATIFNVAGTPTDTNGDGSDWTVTDAAGDTLDYENYGGVPQWYFNSAPSNAQSITTTDGTTATMPNNSAVDADVQGYLTQLGYDYSVAGGQYSTATVTASSPGQADVTTNEETASYTVTIDGVATDQTFDITIDANNNVIEADGPAFTLDAVGELSTAEPGGRRVRPRGPATVRVRANPWRHLGPGKRHLRPRGLRLPVRRSRHPAQHLRTRRRRTRLTPRRRRSPRVRQSST